MVLLLKINCKKCGGIFERYSRGNTVCKKCYEETHTGQAYKGGTPRWKKILNLINET